MSNKLIETISPEKVYNRVILGLLIVVFALVFYDSLISETDDTLKWLLILVGGLFFLSGWKSVANPMRAIRYAQNSEKVVAELIESWAPKGLTVEHDLEKSLHSFLKKELPWVKITRQYGAGRIKCDIAIGKDVMIELKAGFKSTQKLQRLIGQLELYKKEWEKPIIVVLAGETEEDLLHDLNSHARRLEGIQIITKETLDVVEAPEDKASN